MIVVITLRNLGEVGWLFNNEAAVNWMKNYSGQLDIMW